MSKKNKAPTNIILMIADGAGLSQITAAMYENDNKLIHRVFETYSQPSVRF